MRVPDALATMRAGGSIRESLLVFMDFKTQPMRVWLGAGTIKTLDNIEFTGVGDVVAISGGAQVAGLAAPNLSVTIAATAEMVAIAAGSVDEYKGRRFMAAIQFFDENWQVVDRPVPIFTGVMDSTTFEFNEGTQTITLNVESPFVRRRAARLDNLTHASQQAKYPDDLGLEFVHRLQDMNVNWPVFS